MGAESARNSVTERMIRSASDLASLFSEFLQTVTLPTDRPRPGSAPIPDFGLSGTPVGEEGRPTAGHREATAAGREPAPSIAGDVRSRQRVEISVDLRPGGWRSTLIAHDLRSADAKAPRIKAPRIDAQTQQHRVVVRLRVPDAQPSGVYSGVIIDGKTSLPCGALAVRVWRGDPR